MGLLILTVIIAFLVGGSLLALHILWLGAVVVALLWVIGVTARLPDRRRRNK